MRDIVYHRRAVRYLRRMPANRKEQAKVAIAEVSAFDDPSTHPNVKPMKGDWEGCYRIRIGSYRAIYRLAERDEGETMEVLQVGPRGDVY
ncbi:type II toxin-antitoxin system RelE/ParE family toxin [bacterium]|nr:type II toxin-antitoxin system RelE/ParE family toxin [bacterium]